MLPLVLKHLTSNDLPAEWAKQLPTGQVFSVVIVTEKSLHEPSNIEPTEKSHTPLFGIWRDYEATQDVEDYVRYLRKNRKIARQRLCNINCHS